jgi:hypothetical protein
MTICMQCQGAKVTQGSSDIINEGDGTVQMANTVQGAIPCSQCNGVGYY